MPLLRCQSHWAVMPGMIARGFGQAIIKLSLPLDGASRRSNEPWEWPIGIFIPTQGM